MYQQILDPLIGETITIMEDGTSQMNLRNTGRFGFYVERLFGIRPNSNQAPDLAHVGEIKTVQIKGQRFGSCSIGTMSWDNWHEITEGPARSWTNSPPYRKMRRTLFVFYTKAGTKQQPTYRIDRYVMVNFDALDPDLISEIEQDYENIRGRMIQSKGYGVCDFAWLGNLYLSAGTKGDSRYVYPSFNFKSQLMKEIYHA
jgi:hypothetical protein